MDNKARNLDYLRKLLPGGTTVYTISNGRGGHAVLVITPDPHRPTVEDITGTVAAITGLPMRDHFIYYRGQGFNKAAAIIEDLERILFPETPQMQNLGHRSL